MFGEIWKGAGVLWWAGGWLGQIYGGGMAENQCVY